MDNKKKKPDNNNALGNFLGTALIGIGGMAIGYIASKVFEENS